MTEYTFEVYCDVCLVRFTSGSDRKMHAVTMILLVSNNWKVYI